MAKNNRNRKNKKAKEQAIEQAKQAQQAIEDAIKQAQHDASVKSWENEPYEDIKIADNQPSLFNDIDNPSNVGSINVDAEEQLSMFDYNNNGLLNNNIDLNAGFQEDVVEDVVEETSSKKPKPKKPKPKKQSKKSKVKEKNRKQNNANRYVNKPFMDDAIKEKEVNEKIEADKKYKAAREYVNEPFVDRAKAETAMLEGWEKDYEQKQIEKQQQKEAAIHAEKAKEVAYRNLDDLDDVSKYIGNNYDNYEDAQDVLNKAFESKSMSQAEYEKANKLFETHKKSLFPQKRTVKETTEEAIEQGSNQAAKELSENLGKTPFEKIFNKRSMGVIFNAGFAISDYKDARNSGSGVIKSGVKAGALFATGEILGGAMLPVMLAKQAPEMAVNLFESAQTMTREMNSVQRIQTFGDASFHDTPQLATMRQAGMEMAKMSQYNLQQSIMGNEAQSMHRI